jgi:alkanesulfonate monooxygenase SsuD/methylene tetrahydromethanopterin reductase-like flavin-dependent oxidoreductase (luciferase family)
MLRQSKLAEALGETARSPAQVDADRFVIGEPAECIDRIARYAALGVKEIACLMNFGAPEERRWKARWESLQNASCHILSAL